MICNADARQIPLSNNSVQCVITSPPYFGLRDYGVGGQIGLEDSLEDYIEALCCVFDGLWAALRDDGTVWLNLGDSYAGNNSRASHGGRAGFGTPRECIVKRGTKSKDLMFVPHRVAIALQERGWYVRQDIVWHKPNPMPESVTDRCTRAHEYIFMLTKSPRYYYDAASISERAQPHLGKVLDVRSSGTGLARAGISGNPDRAGNFLSTNGFANKRSVWTVTTKPFSGAHFATFPP
jgi:DNA modification methylase